MTILINRKKEKFIKNIFYHQRPANIRYTHSHSHFFFMTNRLVIVMASCFILYLILLALLPSYLGAVFVLAVSYQRKKMEPKPMPMAQQMWKERKKYGKRKEKYGCKIMKIYCYFLYDSGFLFCECVCVVYLRS